MKRKVIQLAGKTYVVSLPSKWVKEWKVKKGDELDVCENGPSIIIKTDENREIKKATVDATHADERVLRWILSSMHKKGYDEIEIQTNNIKLINELLKDLFIGFAIIHQTPNSCTIRSLSKELDDQFENILRRAFLVTLNMADQLHEKISKKDFNFPEIAELEKTNNQLTNFCQRILNKRGHAEQAKTPFLYVIIWNLEKIADDYKYLAEHTSTMKTCTPQTLKLLDETNKLLREYYEIFYKFETRKLDSLAGEYKKLHTTILSELKTSKDPISLNHLAHIVLKIADFSASTFAINDKYAK